MRARARRRAVELLGEEPALVEDGAAFFGQASRGKLQIRGIGCLALGGQRLVFVMWLPRRELVVERSEITAVDAVRSRLGKTVGRRLLRVTFGDDAAWSVGDLDRWLAARA